MWSRVMMSSMTSSSSEKHLKVKLNFRESTFGEKLSKWQNNCKLFMAKCYDVIDDVIKRKMYIREKEMNFKQPNSGGIA